MKTAKKLIYFVAFCLATTTSVVNAENNAEVKAAIEQTVTKLEQAVAALDKGEGAKVVAEMVIEAKQAQKSIATSDPKVSIKKSQGSNKLGQARISLNDGDIKKGGDLVREALADYKEVKEKYNATH